MTITETINRMIRVAIEGTEITSANPTHINTVIQLNTVETPDLEDEIVEAIEEGTIKGNKELNDTKKKVKSLDAGQVGEIQRMTTEQFGNIKQMASDPVQFVFGAMAKKIPKIAKGGFVAGFAILVGQEVLKFIVQELQKPGRPFDIRLKRKIQDEIMIFRRREEKAKLLRGFSRIIVTTMPRLRGGQFQTSDTFRMIAGPGIEGAPSGIGSPGISNQFLPSIEAPPPALPSGAPNGTRTKRVGRGLNLYSKAG